MASSSPFTIVVITLLLLLSTVDTQLFGGKLGNSGLGTPGGADAAKRRPAERYGFLSGLQSAVTHVQATEKRQQSMRI
jgi:hypothetical protein